MRIREIQEIDLDYLEKIVELEEEAFAGKGGVDCWILKALLRYGKVFVLEDEAGELIAIAEFMQVYEKKEVFLYGLCTRRAYRSQGHARRLLEEGEAYFRKRGVEEISLTVDPEHELAIKFYESMDYSRLWVEKDEYGKGVDRLFMKKNLE